MCPVLQYSITQDRRHELRLDDTCSVHMYRDRSMFVHKLHTEYKQLRDGPSRGSLSRGFNVTKL